MPPTSTVSLRWMGMYFMSLCASLEMGSVCSQIFPGPTSAMPNPRPPSWIRPGFDGGHGPYHLQEFDSGFALSSGGIAASIAGPRRTSLLDTQASAYRSALIFLANL
jgi:hypothetical protein